MDLIFVIESGPKSRNRRIRSEPGPLWLPFCENVASPHIYGNPLRLNAAVGNAA
jgi:hypothetical protein